MDGWIKLHRKVIESAVFCNANLFQVWCYCLMRANHQETKTFFMGEEVVLKAGQFITGRFKGAEDCRMKPSTFRNQIAILKKMQNVDTKSDSKNSLITIVKWASYQGQDFKMDTNLDNRRTTEGHRQEGKNERNKRRTPFNEFSIDNLPLNLNGELYYHNEFFFITRTFKTELIEKLAANNLTDEVLQTEFYKMENWLKDNGAKKNYRSFITNWLSKVKNPKQEANTGTLFL